MHYDIVALCLMICFIANGMCTLRRLRCATECARFSKCIIFSLLPLVFRLRCEKNEGEVISKFFVVFVHHPFGLKMIETVRRNFIRNGKICIFRLMANTCLMRPRQMHIQFRLFWIAFRLTAFVRHLFFPKMENTQKLA